GHRSLIGLQASFGHAFWRMVCRTAELLCLLYWRCRGTPQGRRLTGQFVVAVGAISMLRFRISTATKQKCGPISGEECTMLRSKWLTSFFGMMLAIVCGGHAWA